MSEQGRGGKKGKGRGKKHRGRGRGGQQQQQQQQSERESVPGGLQERRDEQQGATALPESQEQPTTETIQPQSQQQSQKQTRKQRRQQLQRQSESTPEVPIPPRDEGTSRGPQPPREEPQGATALPEAQKQVSVETKPPQQGQQQSKKQQQKKQQPKHPDKTDGAGPSKPQEHFPTTPEGARAQPKTPQSPPPQSDTPAQPSMRPQPSATQAKPGPQQPPRGAAKPDSSSRKRDSPPRGDAPKLPRRPDAGGRSGRPIRLRANFLPVKLSDNDIYHYDTTIAVKGKKSGEGYTNSEAPKIIREVVKLYEKENPSGPKLAYDKVGKNIFCKKQIPSFKYPLKFMTDDGRERELSVEVKPAGKVSLFYLNEVLEGKYTDVPYDTMQAIEVVLQQMPKMRTIQVRSSFFDYPTGREKDLGGGLQVWNGTFLSIRPTQWKMMLNVDTCSTAFYKAQPVLDFMCEFLNLRDYPRRLDEVKRRKFAKELKAIKVETTHVKRKQKASGISSRSAKEETFDCEGKRVTVFNYFKEKYNITLQYPDLPCVKIGQKGSLIPIELCRVVENQKKQGRLTGNQTQEMIRHTAIPAPDRLQKIQELIRKLPYHEDPYCRDFGFSIGNDLATIDGRVLDPPVMKYGSGTEMPRDGAWKTAKRMLTPMELREWALISYINNNRFKNRPRRYRGPDNLDDRGMDNFIHYLVQVAKEKGMRMNEHPCYVGTETGFSGTEKLFGNLKSRYPNLQLIVVVLPVDGDDFYEEVKHCGDIVYGIMTQCIKVEKASDDFSDWRKRETLVNLCFKINAKLGGTTFALDKGVKSKILSRPVIIFGADVTHPSPGDKSPSIAAVVASKDSGPTLYNAEVCIQKHRQEMIDGLKESVKNLLKKFHASTRAQPEKIIFYRDGVSEGQFRDVLINELSAIQRACRELSATYSPAITFIVVQKRHHARLFAVDPKDQRGKSRNIPAGTVVDRHICHPTEFNWYLCSHAGIQGTSKPTLYHVLYDDSNFTSDDLQILTNQLCYTYVRCARSVSMPSAPYYAHHVAFRARHHLKMDSSTEGSQASDDSEPQEVTQAMKNLVKIHPNVDCAMYFA